MNTMINNMSFPRTNRRRQITSSGNKIPGSNSVGHKVSWRRRQRQGKGKGGCDSNHHHNGIIRTPLELDKDRTSEEEEDDDDDNDNEGTTSTEFTFDLDDLNISDTAFSSPITDDCVPSSTITPATSASSTREHNTLHNTKKKTLRHRHQVHFGSIEIHEHTIELGGAGIPSTSGPSLSLSWHQQGPSTKLASVIEYEETRPLGCVPRKGIEMLHSRTQRIDVLLSVGYTYREIMACTKECDAIRTQRLQTRKQIQLSTFLINRLRWKTIRNKLLREKKKKNRN
mmetsp:Transcript_27115/g.31180  ORF Transcript_27115/g.31180 Transcript_27115/m.31180 type:complete len:284 (+) Transcript_27115:325-1176(+)